MAHDRHSMQNLWNTQSFVAGTGGATLGHVAHLSAGTVIVADADANDNIGIFTETVDAGVSAQVAMEGCIALAVAYDENIAMGDDLVASGGHVAASTTTTTATVFVVGKALSGSDEAGQLIPILVTCKTRTKATA